ncbi:MAG: hypothetical protein KJO83_03920 [Bacteroidia bacterium]|nr:hypothetical protein [Bacteroidia bacterium]
MIKTVSHNRFLIMLVFIMIIIITYFLWNAFKYLDPFYIISTLAGIIILGLSFAGIFAGINDAKSIEKKFLAGFIGNAIYTLLLFFALFYVVFTMQ